MMEKIAASLCVFLIFALIGLFFFCIGAKSLGVIFGVVGIIFVSMLLVSKHPEKPDKG